MTKLSANLSFLFTDRPLADRFAAAAACGFKAVECNDIYSLAPDLVDSLLSRWDLQLVLINVGAGGHERDLGTGAIPGREAEAADLFVEALRYADILSVPRVHYLAGRRPPDRSLAEADATFLANLARDADLAAERGVALTIEPLNAIDRPDYHLLTIGHARRLLGALARPNIGLQLDLYHCAMRGEALDASIAEAVDELVHVQIAGAPGRREPVGGLVDHRLALSALEAHGYRGWIGCEYQPAADTADGLAWAQSYLEAHEKQGEPGND